MREKDQHAFDDFATIRIAALRRHAHLLTGDPDRAAELTELALADTYRRWRRVGSDGAAAHAFRRLANESSRHRSRSRRPAPAESREPAESPESAADDVRDDVREVVWRALGSLPPRRRAVLVLRHDGDLTDAEIAGRLGISPAAVAAEADAGLAGLARILRRRGQPASLLPAALADPARDLPPVDPPLAAIRDRVRRGRTQRTVLVVTLVAAAVAIPLALVRPRSGSADSVAAELADGTAAVETSALGEIPAMAPAAGSGLLPWAARGPLAGSDDLLRAALQRWRQAAPPARRPATSAAVLYAGTIDGHRVVLLQAIDPAGVPRVAELAVPIAGGGPLLVRAERLEPAVPILGLPPAAGSSSGAGPRLLAPPPAARQPPTSLFVRAASGAASAALRRLRLDRDGLSAPVGRGDPAGGIQVVAVSGADSIGPEVLGSGTLAAGRLVGTLGKVELGAPTVNAGVAGLPDGGWYDDGELLAGKHNRRVVVAAVGPTGRTPGRAMSGVRSRAYEVRWASQRWLGFVVRRNGRPVCTELSRLGKVGTPAKIKVVIHRCSVGGGLGVLHVLAAPNVAAVRVRFDPGAAGQLRYEGRFTRPAGPPVGGGFAVVTVVPYGFPTGPGGMEAVDRRGRVLVRRQYEPVQG
jgi:DNA-directed RNA polymerase specialized sigma24 family protein